MRLQNTILLCIPCLQWLVMAAGLIAFSRATLVGHMAVQPLPSPGFHTARAINLSLSGLRH